MRVTQIRRTKLTLAAIAATFLAGCSSNTPSAETKTETKEKPAAAVGSILRLDPALDELIPKDAQIEKLSGGFTFIEGPLWRANIGSGALWFSDVIGNIVRQWTPDGKVIEILNPGGYDGKGNLPAGGYNGPNGMASDQDGAVLLCQHGYRRIVRIDKNMQVTPVVDKFEGKRLNSPNDVVFRSDGAFYFTDPPYGLGKGDADSAKEQKFNGVYRYKDGKLQAVIRDLTTPNGIAFSPDQNTLYIGNSDTKHMFWGAYDVNPDGTVKNARVLLDVSNEKEAGVPDGMKVDSKGNIYGTGPGGIWVLSPEGKHLGTIKPPETAANCGWGDDGKSLYITAQTGLYRLKLAVAGEKPLYQ